MKKNLLPLIAALTIGCAGAQPIDDARLADIAQYIWYDKDNDRYLMLFPHRTDDILFNDWTGTPDPSQADADAYRGQLENGRLVIPADTEHHAPRCELELEGWQLIYRCEGKIPGIDLETPGIRNVLEPLKKVIPDGARFP